MIHDAGARACVDGVAYGAHRAIDVKAWDVDFYLCSTYKLYGPHLALLYGKRAHLEQAAPLNHFFLDDELPLKLNPGGPNHELSAGLAGITAYLDALHAHHEGETNRPLHGRLSAIFERIAAHEEALGAPLLEFLASKPGVRLIGNPSADRHVRAPTFSFAVDGREAGEIARAVSAHKVAIGAGDFYAARCIEALGLADRGGVVRASMVHYNTMGEVERLIRALDEAIPGLVMVCVVRDAPHHGAAGARKLRQDQPMQRERAMAGDMSDRQQKDCRRRAGWPSRNPA